jgi:hypothetical protein
MELFCLTCKRKLTPKTSVPRWSGDMLSENNRRFVEEQRAQRQKEIENDELGLYGEGQFCTKDCAAFFARSVVAILKSVEVLPSPFEDRIRMVQKLAERMFVWVRERIPK